MHLLNSSEHAHDEVAVSWTWMFQFFQLYHEYIAIIGVQLHAAASLHGTVVTSLESSIYMYHSPRDRQNITLTCLNEYRCESGSSPMLLIKNALTCYCCEFPRVINGCLPYLVAGMDWRHDVRHVTHVRACNRELGRNLRKPDPQIGSVRLVQFPKSSVVDHVVIRPWFPLTLNLNRHMRRQRIMKRHNVTANNKKSMKLDDLLDNSGMLIEELLTLIFLNDP